MPSKLNDWATRNNGLIVLVGGAVGVVTILGAVVGLYISLKGDIAQVDKQNALIAKDMEYVRADVRGIKTDVDSLKTMVYRLDNSVHVVRGVLNIPPGIADTNDLKDLRQLIAGRKNARGGSAHY